MTKIRKRVKLSEPFDLPAYATCYIEYGEDGTLSDEDKNNIDNFIEKLSNEAPKGFHFSYIGYDWDTDPSFSSTPVFGLPVECIKARAVYFNNIN